MTRAGPGVVRWKRTVVMGLAAASGAVSLLLVAAPAWKLSDARATLDTATCAFGPEGPPQPPFFEALDELDSVARFPGFGGSATELKKAVEMRCAGGFILACAEVRYDAEDRARDKARARRDAAVAAATTDEERDAILRGTDLMEDDLDWQAELGAGDRAALCSPWQQWIEYLKTRDGAGAVICPVCVVPPTG